MFLYFARWKIDEYLFSRAPIATFYDGIKIGEFSSFSEYWMRHEGIDLYEIKIIESCYKNSSQPSIAVDVGANLGLFSLALAKSGFCQVYAFEPIQDTYDRFLANIGKNPILSDRIIPNRIGVGSSIGTLDFIVNSKSPGQNKIAICNTLHTTRSRCDVTTLDAYFSRINTGIAFLKIDVEGFESEVIKGCMSTLLSGQIQFIYSEIIADALNNAGSSVSEYWGLLHGAGFEPVVLDESVPSCFKAVSFDAAFESAGGRRNVLFRFANRKQK